LINQDPLELLALLRTLSRPGNRRYGGLGAIWQATLRWPCMRDPQERGCHSAAQRRIELKSQAGKGTLSPQRQEYARYVMVFTTLPDQAASVDQVLEGYRCAGRSN